MHIRTCITKSVTIITASALILTACTSKKQKAAENLSDALRTDYTSNISFTLDTSESRNFGNATVTKKDCITRIDIHSPEPYSGLSVEYNVKGLPDSIAMHFSGMDVSLPTDAVAKINPVTSLFADDFAQMLSKLPSESIKEYETDGQKGICASLTYNGADISVYFSADGAVPYSLEYSSDKLRAELVFDTFKKELIES